MPGVSNWKTNALMFWHDGFEFKKVTDHNRSALDITVERLENLQRMAGGRMRRQVVGKKRTFTCSWENLPAANNRGPNTMATVDGGMAGEDIEKFHDDYDQGFNMQLREGNGDITTYAVMITDFSKTVVKRGINDLWNLTITLTEV